MLIMFLNDLHSYINNIGCSQIIFDNIMNREIPWPQVPEELSFEAYDLINKYVIKILFLKSFVVY